MRDNIFRKNSKTLYICVLAFALLMALLLALPITRHGIIGIFGWASIPYTAALGVYACIMLTGKKAGVRKGKIVLYLLTFQLFVCTLHVFLTKDYFIGQKFATESYVAVPLKLAIESPYSGTVGGVVAAVIILPIKLLVTDFGATAALEFAITGVLGLIALLPLFSKIKDSSFKSLAKGFKQRKKTGTVKEKSTIGDVGQAKPVGNVSVGGGGFVPSFSAGATPSYGGNISAVRANNTATAGTGSKEPINKNNTMFLGLASEEKAREEMVKQGMAKLYGQSIPTARQPAPQNDINRKLTVLRTDVNKPIPEQIAYGHGTLNGVAPVQAINKGQRTLNGKSINELTNAEKLVFITSPSPYSEESVSPWRKTASQQSTATEDKYRDYISPVVAPKPMENEVKIDFNSTFAESPLTSGMRSAAFANPTPTLQTAPQAPVYRSVTEQKPVVQTPAQPSIAEQKPVVQAPAQPSIAEQKPVVQTPAQPSIAEQKPVVQTPAQPNIADQKPVNSTATPQNQRSVEFGAGSSYQTTLDDFADGNEPRDPAVGEDDDAYGLKFNRQMMNYQYNMPPISLLAQYPPYSVVPDNYDEMKAKIEDAMDEYKVRGEVIGAIRGPSFTQYEVQLARGVDTSKVKIQHDNIKMRLAVKQLGVEIPIACRNSVGLEIPNEKCDIVGFRDIITSEEFQQPGDNITIGFGRDIYGKIVCDNLVDMPHLLVAGTTGGGKSVFIHDLIMSVIYKYSPEEVRFLMIDPKQVEFSQYNGMPHMLVQRAATNCDEALSMLSWVAAELQRRNSFLSKYGVNNIRDYNNYKEESMPRLHRIIVIVDEVAELMLQSKGEVESAIQSIAQLGRSCGVHIVLSTQRPVAGVISGIIKSNIACRVACKVTTGIESSIVLDKVGAEHLLGHGDMIYRNKTNDFKRLQGAFIDPMKEITPIVSYLIANNKCIFDESVVRAIFNTVNTSKEEEKRRLSEKKEVKSDAKGGQEFTMDDDLVKKTIKYFIRERKASISSSQVYFGIGYLKSKKIMNFLIDNGVVSSTAAGNGIRDIVMTAEEYEARYGEKAIEDTAQSDEQ